MAIFGKDEEIIGHLNRINSKLSQLDSIRKSADDFVAYLDKHKFIIEEEAKRIEKREEKLSEYECNVNSLAEQILTVKESRVHLEDKERDLTSLLDSIKTYEAKLARNIEECCKKEVKLDVFHSEISEFITEMHSERKLMRTERLSLNELSENLQTRKMEIIIRESELHDIETKKNTIHAEITELQNKITELKGEKNTTSSKLNELNEKIKLIEEREAAIHKKNEELIGFEYRLNEVDKSLKDKKITIEKREVFIEQWKKQFIEKEANRKDLDDEILQLTARRNEIEAESSAKIKHEHDVLDAKIDNISKREDELIKYSRKLADRESRVIHRTEQLDALEKSITENK
ncbi:MAG TPA: hypothetical protein VFC41_06970 [Anaerovoracaceae bacterium]|nr:hypothetical protein [Anaerovoracaceae bacterium]